MSEYIAEQKSILKDFHIWRKMSKSERKAFNGKITEISLDNFKRSLFAKYLA